MATPKFVEVPLTVAKGAFSHCRSGVSQYQSDGEFVWLMGIMGGQTVNAHVYSPTNVVGHTTEAQIREAYENMPEDLRFYIKEEHLERVVAKFGVGEMGFTMSGMLMEETPASISHLVDTESESSLTF